MRKRKHPTPPLDEIDPLLASTYVEELHGKKLCSELDLSHLDNHLRTLVYRLIQKYWSVFDDKGQFMPVKDYSCKIDTGTACPIAIKKIHYGPCKTPIMRKCIASLAKLGHICQIHGGQWQFKVLLAAKPHKEGITNIDNFVWRFCVNYIPLNQITHPEAYMIPRCNSAVNLIFGKGTFFWLWDAPQGYHQIRVEPSSQEKLAFAGPDTKKWTYNVMPFGPVNGPAIFIAFMHDLVSTWKDLARSLGLTIDKDLNTNVIVDDILSWEKSVMTALVYMECQLHVAQSQNLLLNLKKSSIFTKQLEFIGIDMCIDGKRPAMSKHQLIKHWPKPEIVRDVAKFVGFMQFYLQFIPNFETRIAPLQEVMQDDYTVPVGTAWMDHANAAFDEMRQAILSDPVLCRYDHRKLLVLRMDFSANGFGYVACQPTNNDVSLQAMHKQMQGSDFNFMQKTSCVVLHPVAFGCQQTRGTEK